MELSMTEHRFTINRERRKIIIEHPHLREKPLQNPEKRMMMMIIMTHLRSIFNQFTIPMLLNQQVSKPYPSLFFSLRYPSSPSDDVLRRFSTSTDDQRSRSKQISINTFSYHLFRSTK